MIEPREAGRHEAPGQPPFRLSASSPSGLAIRLALLVGGLVVGLAVAAWHWIVNTALLGARLPVAVHVLVLGIFLAVVLTAVVVAARRGYRGLARWSQARWRHQRR